MKIYKQGDNIIIDGKSVPYWQTTYDWGGKPFGKIQNVIGLIEGDRKALHRTIEMGYCGKDPQIDGEIVVFDGSKDEFKKLCKDLKIECEELPICKYCGKAIWGSFNWEIEGAQCFECELKKEK